MTEQQDKILVVDDDARLRSLLQRFLEEAGYAVKAVADAEPGSASGTFALSRRD